MNNPPRGSRAKANSPHNPTPYLGLPRRDEKIFTVQENRLLDQITTEIILAWKDDLLLIKQHHIANKKLLDSLKGLQCELSCFKETIKGFESLNTLNNLGHFIDLQRNALFSMQKLDQEFQEFMKRESLKKCCVPLVRKEKEENKSFFSCLGGLFKKGNKK
jgi:ABC-type hemin transport system substrate-binding protein